MKTNITLAAVAISLFAAAQSYAHEPRHVAVSAPYYDYGYHSSTAAEGAMRGAADYVRSTGEADLYHSMAAVNYEEAQSASIENQQQAAETYFAMRKMNEEFRAAEAGPRVTRYEAERISDSRLPDRLDPEQYSPVQGQLYWPSVLRGQQYASQRAELDRLMSERYSGISSDSDIQRLALQMQDLLDSQARRLSSSDYLSGKRFLDSLCLEATLPASSTVPALASLD